MEKLLLIINPVSGKRQARNKLLGIVDIFRRSGFETTVATTAGRGDAITLARDGAERFDRIVCCGGDGTLNEVISGLMQTEHRPPLGYIPAGSTNDLASSLKLPRDLYRAAEKAATGAPADYDIGCFCDRKFFTYVASFGAFTETSYSTKQPLKNALGHLAYLLEGAKSLPRLHPYRIRMEHDGGVIEGNFLFGAIANSTSMGGIVRLAESRVKFNDGKMEIILIKNPRNPLELQRILHNLIQQKYTPETVLLFHSQKAVITAFQPMPWSLDGEFEPGGQVITVEALHSAIRLIY